MRRAVGGAAGEHVWASRELRFSVRLIDGTDNETGGRRLDQMYTLKRILDGDAFYMKITN